MIFGPTPLDRALGSILAHTRRLPGLVLKKGAVLDSAAIDALRAAGHDPVIAATLEPGDVPEDEAATPPRRRATGAGARPLARRHGPGQPARPHTRPAPHRRGGRGRPQRRR